MQDDNSTNHAGAGLPVGAQNILLPISIRIHKYNANLPKAKDSYKKIGNSYVTFLKNFIGNPIQFVVLGFLGLATLYFDILIGLETLLPLSEILKIHIMLVSVIFAIIDTGVSIMSSGILAIGPISRAIWKKRGRLILKLLGIIKLTLMIVYMTSFPEMDVQTIAINSLFIILIYSIFHISGSGLLYLLGNSLFQILLFLSDNPSDLDRKINKLGTLFDIKCNELNVHSQTAKVFFKVDTIV